MKRAKLLFLLASLGSVLAAEEYMLEQIDVEKSPYEPSIQLLSETQARKTNSVTLQERIERDVSFSVITDNKGEPALSFRGLGFMATGYIEDDIPLYRNVNGFVDPKFVMTDATLEINDGSGTGTLGVTPVGGEVLIYTHTPDDALNISLYSTVSQNDLYAYTSAGSRQGSFYVQADAGYYRQNSYRLSSDFTPTAIQPDKERLNSDVLQHHLSFKLGWFVDDSLHIAAKVALMRSRFGMPPNVTIDPAHHIVWNDFSRINDKSLDSFYLYGDYSTEDTQIIFRAYHDTYEDIYDIYDDSFYTQKWPSVLYDDSRTGAIFKTVFEQEAHQSTLIVQYESNRHTRKGGNRPEADFRADTLRLSLLHRWKINGNWSFDGGLSYTSIQAKEADIPSTSALPDTKEGFDAQMKLTYSLTSDLLYGAVAHKTLMPSMREMFPFFDWVEPNLSLKPEKSWQYSLGYQHDFKQRTRLDLSLYYYDIKDIIINDVPADLQYHAVYLNRDHATHYGAELRLQTKRWKDHTLCFSYAYAHTRDNEGKLLPLIPEHQLMLEDTLVLTPDIQAYIAYRYTGKRYSDNSATYARELHALGGYHTVDLQLSYNPTKETTLRIGANNLLDSSYEWRYGYPAKGREYYFAFEWKLP